MALHLLQPLRPPPQPRHTLTSMSSAARILLRMAAGLRRHLLRDASIPMALPLSGVLLLYAWRRWRTKRTGLVNWCGDFEAKPSCVHYPQTEGEIRAIVLDAARRNERVKVAGGLHSWSDIAMPAKGPVTQFLILDRFNRVLHLDEAARTITVEVRPYNFLNQNYGCTV